MHILIITHNSTMSGGAASRLAGAAGHPEAAPPPEDAFVGRVWPQAAQRTAILLDGKEEDAPASSSCALACVSSGESLWLREQQTKSLSARGR